ncbi:MAG: HEAT repeat domain-containing protein [Chloroflexi bacterium]|nr:HEAT repeat domain-containing protein [Chloroflexota bacterium]
MDILAWLESVFGTRGAPIVVFFASILLFNLVLLGMDEWGRWQDRQRAKQHPMNGDPKLRAIAARALGEIGEARAIEPLITALHDESAQVCQAAAESLGRLGDKRAIEPLREILSQNQDPKVRIAAAEALGRFHDARAAESLIVILATPPTVKANV